MNEIKMKQKDLDKLIADKIADALKVRNTGVVKKKVKTHTGYLRTHNGRYIIRTDGSNEVVRDKNGFEHLSSLYTLYEVKDGKVKEINKRISWDEVSTLPRVMVDIIRHQKDDTEITGDRIEVINYENGKQVRTGRYVDDTVIIPEPSIKVMTEEGYEIDIDPRIINI